MNIIIYDFDGTLTPEPIPKFEILEQCGINGSTTNPIFLQQVNNKINEKGIDLYQAIYEVYLESIKASTFELIDSSFILGYDKVKYNKGVKEFLNFLNKNNIKNYLLSSGIKVFLDNISISKYFTEIYATTFHYNEKMEATGIDYLMNDKNKIDAIKEIMKENNCKDCSSIIYIGDGLTDYYAMEYVSMNGGIAIFVYQNANSNEVKLMKEKNIVHVYYKADYSLDSALSNYIFEKYNLKIKRKK